MPATYEPIATTTLASAQPTITFSSIAASWTDLRLIVVGTVANNGQDLYIKFNGSSSGYSRTWLSGAGVSATSGANTSQSVINLTQNGSLQTTTPTLSIIDIFSYAGSRNKTVLSSRAGDRNGAGASEAVVGLWANTSAITSIEISNSSGNFNTNTTVTLYGILRA